jgi:phage tail sheath gpL-like
MIVIDGYSDADKIPGFFAETKFGVGGFSINAIPLVFLLVGLKGTAGTIVADVDVKEVNSFEEARTYGDSGSEVTRMAARAFDQGLGGVRLKMACPLTAAGAAATATITFTGTSTGAGTHYFYVGGELIAFDVLAGVAAATAATNLVTKITGMTHLPVSAGAVGAAVTLTVKCVGVRGNDYILFRDDSKAPAGLTSAVAGGTSVTGGGVRFTGGTGTETLTNLRSLLYPARYHRMSLAQNDAVSLAAWETHVDDKAGVLEGRMEHVCVAGNGTLGASQSLAQTTLNNARFQFLWLLNSESHPSEIAAAMGAIRASTEGSKPNAGYDGRILKGIKPQRYRADWPNRSTQQSALDNSVTPLTTNEENQVVVVRSITTRSVANGGPDYSCMDTNKAVVPDYCRDRYRALWFKLRETNEYVKPNPGTGEKEPPEGVLTPDRWAKEVLIENQNMEDELILTQTMLAANKPQADWNSAAERIMCAAPVVPLPLNHALGMSIRQTSIAA